MNKIKYFFILLIAGASFVSCSKSRDEEELEPIRDYATQYATDRATIDSYLNTHSITVTQNAGNVSDMDVKFDSITNTATQVSIMSYKANVGTSTFPQLKSKNVNLYGVDFQLYYLVLREGIGESPINTDGVLTSYKVSYLTDVAKTSKNEEYVSDTDVEELRYPQTVFDLSGIGAPGAVAVAVKGWGETFPEFKTGDAPITNGDGSVTYTNFGAGVMFLPSALGYYTGNGNIPAYSPLIFSFKLYKVVRLDHDISINANALSPDGIPDYLEDLNGDGYVYDYRNTTLYPTPPATNPDDTDGDGIPDFLDVDDDGDGFTTKLEITKPANEYGVVNGVNFGPSRYYPYDAFTVADNPATPGIDESLNSEPKGIPAFAVTGEPDYTSSGRLRLHLDKAHHTPKP